MSLGLVTFIKWQIYWPCSTNEIKYLLDLYKTYKTLCEGSLSIAFIGNRKNTCLPVTALKAVIV